MSRYYALIPAAGQGARMGNELPKQYLPLLKRPMIGHAIARLCSCEHIERVYVVLAQGDAYWQRYDWQAFSGKLAPLFCGGETRAQSVLNGLSAMADEINSGDWVLVHDAARPCLSQAHLEQLIREIGEDETGGLLAVPVADTLKRADAQGRVLDTQPRENLWQAQTPQMFRAGLLKRALESMQDKTPTDESRAVENLGLHPKLVACDSSNLKVTYPQDMELAQIILEKMGAGRCE